MNVSLFGNSFYRYNQIKMRLYWIRLGLNLMTHVHVRRGKFGHRENATWQWRQRLEWYIYKSRNTRGYRQARS